MELYKILVSISLAGLVVVIVQYYELSKSKELFKSCSTCKHYNSHACCCTNMPIWATVKAPAIHYCGQFKKQSTNKKKRGF